MSSNRLKYLTLLISFFPSFISGQQDTIKYPWPLAPTTLQRDITGTFAEYRSTSISGHYHDGIDIPAPSGTPVLAVLLGTVNYAYDDGYTGYDSYVRVVSVINGKTKQFTYYIPDPPFQ